MAKRAIEVGMRVVVTDSRRNREGTVMEVASEYEGDEKPDHAKVRYDLWWKRDEWVHTCGLFPIRGVTP